MSIVIAVVSSGFRENNASIALITKVVREVDKKRDPSEWRKAYKGDILNSGDGIRTHEQSLAIIKFKDNSILRVREQSTLKINEATTGKTVGVEDGRVGFEIQKQNENMPFKFTSPTSVASIRGTEGMLSAGSENDTLIILAGLVTFSNKVSNKDVDVGEGYIGFSGKDGSVSSRKATDQEISAARNALLSNSVNELNLELKDSKGNKKELKIRYK